MPVKVTFTSWTHFLFSASCGESEMSSPLLDCQGCFLLLLSWLPPHKERCLSRTMLKKTKTKQNKDPLFFPKLLLQLSSSNNREGTNTVFLDELEKIHEQKFSYLINNFNYHIFSPFMFVCVVYLRNYCLFQIMKKYLYTFFSKDFIVLLVTL